MKIPKIVKIGSYKYKVIITDDNKLLGNEDTWGRANTSQEIIALRKSISEKCRKEVFFHEIFEEVAMNVCYVIGQELTHDRFSSLSTSLYEVLMRNKMLVE